jgi:hypothetical protein
VDDYSFILITAQANERATLANHKLLRNDSLVTDIRIINSLRIQIENHGYYQRDIEIREEAQREGHSDY